MHYMLFFLVQVVFIVPSILLYMSIVLYMCTSKDPEYQSAFHRLFIARAPADIIQVLTSVIAFRLPILGWQFASDHPIMAKIGFVVSQYVVLLELCALCLLSANRMTAIAFPLEHNKLWSTTRLYFSFLVSALLSLIPTVVRIPQPAGYMENNGSYVPHLINPGDQEKNSTITCILYVSFCVASLSFNIAAITILAKQRSMQLFETQQHLAIRVQQNLLVYSCIFTFIVCAMTITQLMLAFNAFPLRSDLHNYVIVTLSFFADALALLNPWLLIILSKSFCQKFRKTSNLQMIFAPSGETGETA